MILVICAIPELIAHIQVFYPTHDYTFLKAEDRAGKRVPCSVFCFLS